MNEIKNQNHGRIRGNLLVGVSLLALAASAHGSVVFAEDDARPTVWIEIGAQLDRINGSQQPFLPGFTTINPSSSIYGPVSPAEAQRSSRYDFGGEGKITFEPEGSDWMVSASIRYGRANGAKAINQQTHPGPQLRHLGTLGAYLTPNYVEFFESRTKNRESHFIVDFNAGRDVGVGAFGRAGSSNLNFGIRFAQFTNSAHTDLNAVPIIYSPTNLAYAARGYRTVFDAHSDSRSSFQGIGPSLSWDASASLIGNNDQGVLSVDWELAGALLFGRQKSQISHTSSLYHHQKYNNYGITHPPVNAARSRSIVVPNVGGELGLSFRFPDAKVEFGYRADIYFGAMDTGLGSRKNSDRAFYGPFAAISVGLGG